MNLTHTEAFPDSQAPRKSWGALVLALLITAALFMVIPLSKLLMPTPEVDTMLREIIMTATPPPQAPPPPEDFIQKQTAEPDYQPHLPELSLQQLQLSLEPGMSDALAMGVSIGKFNTEFDVVAEMEKIFSFDELEAVPQLIHAPRISFPPELKRRGLSKGTVVMIIIIDEAGRVSVERIVSATHPAFKDIARRTAERTRFSVTRINGEAVKVRGRFPLTIEQ